MCYGSVLQVTVTQINSVVKCSFLVLRQVIYIVITKLQKANKTPITNKCTKRVILSIVTFLHVSTLLGHLQGELSVTGPDSGGFTPPKTTQYTVNSAFSLNYKAQP
jgi:hypothetical protein